MKLSPRTSGWFIALAVLILRACCRIRLHNDPRPKLRARSQTYAYSVLHCHQIAAVIHGERGTGAMVSRSADGGLLIPSLLLCGIVPIRGSKRQNSGDKGGLAAIGALDRAPQGRRPSLSGRGRAARPAKPGPQGNRRLVATNGRGGDQHGGRTRAAVDLTPAWDRFLKFPSPLPRSTAILASRSFIAKGRAWTVPETNRDLAQRSGTGARPDRGRN